MIGERIKWLREKIGMTQDEIARDPAFGVKRGTLAAYEQNAREPNIETIARLAQYFNVTTDYLIGMSDHKRPQADDDELAPLLSDGSLEFLRDCDPGLLETVDSVLASGRAPYFFEELRSYVLALDSGNGDLPEYLFPLVDHLSRGPDADQKAVQFFRSYKRELMGKELDELCEAIRAADPGEKRLRGRPKKQRDPEGGPEGNPDLGGVSDGNSSKAGK